MNPQSGTDLGEFQRFLTEKVNRGDVSLSPEEVLDEWRLLHPDPAELETETLAIQEALDDLKNGDRGIAFDEFDGEFRARHNLPPKS